jgi:hypothetical protein
MEYQLRRPELDGYNDGGEQSEDEQGEQDEQRQQGDQGRNAATFDLSGAVARLAARGIADAVRSVRLSGTYGHGIVAGLEVLQQLTELPNLSALSTLSDLSFSNDGLSAMSCLSGLAALDMQYCECSNQQLLQGLPDVVEHLPLLRKLVLPNCCTDEDLLSTAEQQALKDRLMGMPHLSCVGL